MDLTQAQIEVFERDGVFVLRDAIDRRWRERLAGAIESDIVSPGPFYHGYTPKDGQGKFHGNVRMWQHDADFLAYCFESELPALARQLFSASRVNLLYDQLFVKEPGTLNPTRWHNDQPYWPIRGWQVVSFWLALDRTTQESGALEFIRGSHRWDRWFQPERFGDTAGFDDYERNPNYEPMPDIDATRADYDIVTWDLEPGDLYVFHGLTVHAAGGNRTAASRRRGLAVRYTGEDVVYDTRPGSNVHLRSDRLADGAPLDSEQFPVVPA